MSTADILILIVVILILSAIIFFRYIFPRIRGKKVRHCDQCPVGSDKKIKSSLKAYKKSEKKDHDSSCNCSK